MTNSIKEVGNEKSKIKKRVKWIDASRGLAFLMVIYSHLEFSNSTIMRYFSPVFLTTFFFVSGYLFKENHSFKYVFEQRTRTLLLPFISLGFIMIFMKQIFTLNEKISLTEGIKGLLFQNGTDQILWFIAALYVYSIVFYWVEKFSKNPTNLLLLASFLFAINTLYTKITGGFDVPWHIESTGYACFYMGIGKYYKEKEEKLQKYFDNKYIILLCSFVYIGLITYFNLHVSYSCGNYGIDALLVTIPGIILMIYISKHILQNNKLLLFVGANTLFYFAFHGKGYSILQTLIDKLISPELLASIFVQTLIAFSIVIADSLLLIIPAIIVNKYFPWLLGKGFKLWKTKV